LWQGCQGGKDSPQRIKVGRGGFRLKLGSKKAGSLTIDLLVASEVDNSHQRGVGGGVGNRRRKRSFAPMGGCVGVRSKGADCGDLRVGKGGRRHRGGTYEGGIPPPARKER